jgi:DNA-binding response OmpR family regulator
MIVTSPGAMSMPPKRILVIEDDREIARLILEELTDRGYDVRIAHDGREGCSAILTARPDLVLSDVMMPTMSGFDVLEMLASAAPPLRGVPFVFLTGLCGRDVECKARELGADAFVTKPIDFEALDRIIAARLSCGSRTEPGPEAFDNVEGQPGALAT